MSWDYLIVTASHEAQARAYEVNLRFRRDQGLLRRVRHTLVVPDTDGKRIGSGGSTLCCLDEVIGREGGGPAEDVLSRLRVLIIHAGGDSRRLPAYSPCGKVFLPVPGGRGDVPATLFDLIAGTFLELPPPAPGRGQVVVTSGDALIRFDPGAARFGHDGITALSCYTTPQEASRHGVYCLGEGARVRRFLQKPSPAEQEREGPIGLDVGVMSLDARAAARVLEAFAGRRHWMLAYGIDLYREICCAMGSEVTREHYIRSVRASGSQWTNEMLETVFPVLCGIPLSAEMLPACEFLHFGSTRQLNESAAALTGRRETVVLNSVVDHGGSISGPPSWVEGCRVAAPLHLGGGNVLTGVDAGQPLSLPPEACLDVQASSDGRWFVRCYGARDTFKDHLEQGATFCGMPMWEWVQTAGLTEDGVWPHTGDRTLWTARVFPAVKDPGEYRRYLWMFDPAQAQARERQEYAAAARYSAAEIAQMADQNAFHSRRVELWKQGRKDHVDLA